MLTSLLFRYWRGLAAGCLLVLGSRPASAQLLPAAAPAQAYNFLTLTLITAPTKNMARLLIAPAFNGRTEVQLEPVIAISPASRLEQLRHNDEVLAQSLGELSAAGWELIQVLPAAPPAIDKDLTLTRYLLRRPTARP